MEEPPSTSVEDPQEVDKKEEETPEKPSPKTCTTFNEDVVEVTHKDGTKTYAVVTRCWADEQNPEALAEAKRLGIDFTPLQHGWLEVLHPDGTRTEVLESSTQIVDRGFLRGDIVRPARAPGTRAPAVKPQAGIIVDIDAQVQLQRVLEPHERLEEWYDSKLLVASARINRGDHVVYGDWVGLVEEVFEMAMIETGNGGLRRVCDVGTNLSVGPATEAVQDMLMERTGGFLSNFLGTNDVKNILDIKQLSVMVNWLCRNPLSTSTTDSDWQRPKRYWTDLDQLKLVRATADHLRTIHDKLVPRNPSQFPSPTPSRHLSTFPRAFQIYTVRNARSTLKILWQDGTVSSGPSSSFEQVHVMDDETEVFPGDLGMFSGVQPAKCGVVQSMDRRKRTIRLKYLGGTGQGEEKGEEEEVVSAMEFDPHGPPQHEYGVRRGDWVLIAREGEGNGVDLPEVPSLGESETRAGLMPDGEQLRFELSSLGLAYAQNLSDSFISPEAQSSPDKLASIKWYGEVWDLLLDGRALVRFPDGTKEIFPVTRLYHLDDGMDPHGDMMQAAAEMGADGPGGDGDFDDQEMTLDGEDGWMTEDDEGEGSERGEVDTVMQEEKRGKGENEEKEGNGTLSRKRKRSRRESRGWADDDDEEDAKSVPRSNPRTEESTEFETAIPSRVESTTDTPSTAVTPAEQEDATTTTAAAASSVSMPADIEDVQDWKRFEVLEEVPTDHHYSNEVIQVPSKSFMSRVRKEHGVLASSLPPNILVRAYESRLDLMRCLIIGPPGTPFQNAPFLFDLFLSPSKFPQEPPQVFFHSWAGGTRVSPNLYAEGKVCLSLLGTWSGDKTESWSSARSSILQILISIQGLIMVEDPYFTEPGFEKQMGTAEGTTASELYNERTLVLTRNFVRRACEYPPANFEREIAHYFYSPESNALAAIVEQSRALLEESDEWHANSSTSTTEEGGEGEPTKSPQSKVVSSLRVLTEGGALSLRRTLKALEELKARGPK
ncbi:ubiquitin-conjugating enzyme E2 [Sporobolomyces salmoneus]|uniref:ubiquitin-conjugating enzyme E2 n=1 Tax=Sporobolomyces salmoneus TaxID=183962 RepID=UPI003171F92F